MESAQSESDDFSLVLGGPLYQLLLKARLARPPLQLLLRRMVVIPLVAWLPLLILSLIDGRAVAGVRVPFLFDIEAHARFLIAMPILILAELPVHQRMQTIIPQFRECGLVPPEAMPMFESAIDLARRLRNSVAAELAILAIVLAVGPWFRRYTFAPPADTWHASVDNGRVAFTWAGACFIYLSAPMFQFILFRWYFRLLLWWRFLWQVSRLPLDLKAAHPDLAGGLGFLGESVSCFAPVLFAQGALVAGAIASRIFFGGRHAAEFGGEVILLIILLVGTIVFPLLFFSPRLIAVRRTGIRRYGVLGATYVREFERKWLNGSPPADQQLVGSSDIQSLADLAASYDIVRQMKPVPLDRWMLIQLVAATSAPFVPLILTVIPLKELISRVLKMML